MIVTSKHNSHNGGHPLVAFRKTLILLLVVLLASAAEARLGSMQFKQHVDEMETTAVNKAASNKHRALARKGWKKLPKPNERALNAPPTDKFRELALEKAAARKKPVAEKKKLVHKKPSGRALNAPPTDKFRELALEKAAARKKAAEKKKLAPKKKSVPP